MEFILLAVAGIAGLVSIVCWILILIKMFQTAGALQGILGIICSLWAFIWGWMNADRLGAKNIMLAWSAAIVVGIIFQIAGQAMAQ